MVAHIFEFFVNHVVEAAESSLLDAAGQPSTKEASKSLFFVNIFGCRVHGCVSMKKS